MSTAIYEAMANGMNQLNTALTAAFMPDDTKCYLLKRGEHSAEWDATEIENGFNVDPDTGEFSVATTDESFADAFALSTHIAYGAGDSLMVYEFEDESKTTTPHDAWNPFYLATISREPVERYEVA